MSQAGTAGEMEARMSMSGEGAADAGRVPAAQFEVLRNAPARGEVRVYFLFIFLRPR
jgi:hypothetical protein